MASLPGPDLTLLYLLLLLSTTAATKIHDLLPQYGFPHGIIPNAVKSYSISPLGDFTIQLLRPCYVQFDHLVYYDRTIKGKLTQCSVTGLSGIKAKKLFIWMPVRRIAAEMETGMVEFWVGAWLEKFPAKGFEEIPNCKIKGCPHDGFMNEKSPFHSIHVNNRPLENIS